MTSSKRYRAWTFTLNNYNEDDKPELWNSGKHRYLIYGHEKGDNGTPHIQGYIVLNERTTLRVMKTKYNTRCHWEERKGTHPEARDYIKKIGKYSDKLHTIVAGPWEYGAEPEGQGKRTDLDAARDMINEGKSELEVADAMFSTWCRNYKALERYRKLTTPGRSWHTEVLVLVGPTGTGKSRRAFDEFGASAFWLSAPRDRSGGVWWDGYDGHEHVVIDEFYGWMRIDALLRLLDRYPLIVENKGGGTTMLAKKVIITTNRKPRDWYKNCEQLWPALVRRLTPPLGKVEYVGEPQDRYLYEDRDCGPEPIPVPVIETETSCTVASYIEPEPLRKRPLPPLLQLVSESDDDIW